MLKLKSEIEKKVLGYYFLNTGAKKYVNELAKILAADPGNLDRKLKELEREGILTSEFSGKQRYYYLNQRYPLLVELKKIYRAKYGLEKLFGEKFGKLDGLKEAYIFGSYAKSKSEMGQESDIDLLLIGNHSSLAAQRIAAPLQAELQREINIIDLTGKEYLERKRKKDEFIVNIFSGNTIKLILDV